MRKRGFRISEFRLPLRGGEDGAAIVDQFEKVELLLPRECVRFANVLAWVGGAAAHIESDMLHGFAGCHRFDLARNLKSSPLELRSKLSGDRIRAVLIR
ncbi:MAG: hypothetical protein ACLQB1_27680, partial [Streptosporangiaceae bacterium]